MYMRCAGGGGVNPHKCKLPHRKMPTDVPTEQPPCPPWRAPPPSPRDGVPQKKTSVLWMHQWHLQASLGVIFMFMYVFIIVVIIVIITRPLFSLMT